MPAIPAEVHPIRDGLLEVGFREDRLRTNIPIAGSTREVPLLAFADQPYDARTASVAAINGAHLSPADIAAIRPSGAPIVFTCLADRYQLWKQATQGPEFQREIKLDAIQDFFRKNKDTFAPESIYRAKLWGRLEQSFQLDFVDAGFLPMVENQMGQKLTHLIERLVAETKKRLKWTDVSDADGRWLLQSTFWLLAAKILKDKSVPGFAKLDLTQVENVFELLAKHYNSTSPRPVPVSNSRRREALIAAAQELTAFANCGMVSTEALAQLYESALIDRAIRRKLGTHSTPTWLVDYIVGKLRPWIENDIPVEDRKVFEPACGHAGFLIAAMRLLSELLPTDWHQSRKAYLRERLHGLELDPFALEIARLSLTLADVPNRNGWALTEANMFKADLLERGARDATIVLCNPPFEPFSSSERGADWLPNKAAEAFRRVVEELPVGGVFGFVLPQTFLHAKQAKEVRSLLLRDFEIAEISLFADKVFYYGEPESAVILGRRKAQRQRPILYQRIREGDVEKFSKSYQVGSATEVKVERLSKAPETSFLIPDLEEVWQALEHLPKLQDFADVGQGFSHRSDGDARLPKGVIKESHSPRKEFTPGFASWSQAQMTHDLPPAVWLNLDSATILAPRWGTEPKPQVLLNYARVGRDAWRLKALIDKKGHPFTSRFLAIRPKIERLSLTAIWGICNSPLSNAYAYCRSNKRDILTGDIRQMPVPDFARSDLRALVKAVDAYLNSARDQTCHGAARHSPDSKFPDPQLPFNFPTSEHSADQDLKFLHWRIDVEVLRLYNLPPQLERKILDLFHGIPRRGVPFEQVEYFPKGFTDLDRLSDLLAITIDWPITNRRRAKLMDLEEDKKLTPELCAELENLQRLADASVSLMKQPTIETQEPLKIPAMRNA